MPLWLPWVVQFVVLAVASGRPQADSSSESKLNNLIFSSIGRAIGSAIGSAIGWDLK